MTWAAVFLPLPPASGTLEEAHFDSDVEDKGVWRWVRFTRPEDETSWAGCFRGGRSSYDALLQVSGTSDAFVVAGGQGYWVSLLDRAVHHQQRFVAVASRLPGKSLVVVADAFGVTLLSATGLVWETRRCSLDGINFTAVSDDLIVGEAEVPGCVAKFEVEVASGALRGGWDEG